MAHAGPEFVGRRFGDGEVRHRPWRLVRRARLEVGAAITVSRWHEVFTPALTGLGERSHLASARVDLETPHPRRGRDAGVQGPGRGGPGGHSYGGMVITGWPTVSPNGWRSWVTSTPRCHGWAERTGPAAPGRPGPKGALGNGADGPPAARHLRPTAAATNPGAHRRPAPTCCAQQARKTKSCPGTSSAPDRSRGGNSSSSRPDGHRRGDARRGLASPQGRLPSSVSGRTEHSFRGCELPGRGATRRRLSSYRDSLYRLTAPRP
jgi:hypothetical protein